MSRLNLPTHARSHVLFICALQPMGMPQTHTGFGPNGMGRPPGMEGPPGANMMGGK